MRELRRATAQSVYMGPFISKTDGATWLTPASPVPDAQIYIIKNSGASYADAAPANRGSTTTTGATSGYHALIALGTDDTAATGRFRVFISGYEATALPIWEDFAILPESIYDAKYGVVAGTSATTALSLTSLGIVNPAGIAVTITGGGAYPGLQISSGAGATGNAVDIVTLSTDGHGIAIGGRGTGAGIIVRSGTGSGAVGVDVASSASAGAGYGLKLAGAVTGAGAYVRSGAGADTAGVDIASIAASGSGAGIKLLGAVSGSGLQTIGGSSAGQGVYIAAGTGGNGAYIAGNGTGAGLYVRSGTGAAAIGVDVASSAASGAGHGLKIFGALTGGGTYIQGGATSGVGLGVYGGGTGAGLEAQSGTGAGAIGVNVTSLAASGAGIGMKILGAISGSGIQSGGGATSGSGIYAYGGTGGSGLYCSGNGSGNGIVGYGGDTAGAAGILASGGQSAGNSHGFFARGGNLAGVAMQVTAAAGTGVSVSSSGVGISVAPTGSNQGIQVTGGAGKEAVNLVGGTTSGAGIVFTGTGTGSGIYVRSGAGATGNAVDIAALSTVGIGISVLGKGVNGHGIKTTGGNGGSSAAGCGLYAISGTSTLANHITSPGVNSGITAMSNATNGDGVFFQGTGEGCGMDSWAGPNSTGYGIDVRGGTGTSTGSALYLLSAAGATTQGTIEIASAATNSIGIRINAAGTGHGISVTGGSTGSGVYVRSGAGATGNGLDIASGSTNGSGINVAGSGTGAAINATAGASGTGMILRSGTSATLAGLAIINNSSSGGDAVTFDGGVSGDGLHVITIAANKDFNVKEMGDVTKVDGAALASHTAGYFPAEATVAGTVSSNVVSIDGQATIGLHATGMFPADLRYIGGTANASADLVLKSLKLSTDAVTPALTIENTNAGAGNAIDIIAGATGNCVDMDAAGGHGVKINADGHGAFVSAGGLGVIIDSVGTAVALTSSGASALATTSNSTAPAINVISGGTGAGVVITGAGSAPGVDITGGATGTAVNLTTVGNHSPLNITSGGSAPAITLSSVTGHGIGSVTGGRFIEALTTGSGVAAISIESQLGSVVELLSSGGNGSGISITGHGTGHGVTVSGGNSVTSAGHAVKLLGQGIGGALSVSAGASATSPVIGITSQAVASSPIEIAGANVSNAAPAVSVMSYNGTTVEISNASGHAVSLTTSATGSPLVLTGNASSPVLSIAGGDSGILIDSCGDGLVFSNITDPRDVKCVEFDTLLSDVTDIDSNVAAIFGKLPAEDFILGSDTDVDYGTVLSGIAGDAGDAATDAASILAVMPATIVASQADVQGLITAVPSIQLEMVDTIIVPATSFSAYLVHVEVRDEDGSPVNPFAAPRVRINEIDGTVVSGLLFTDALCTVPAVQDGVTGYYLCDSLSTRQIWIKVASTMLPRQFAVLSTADYPLSGNTRSTRKMIIATQSSGDISTIAAQVDDIHSQLPVTGTILGTDDPIDVTTVLGQDVSIFNTSMATMTTGEVVSALSQTEFTASLVEIGIDKTYIGRALIMTSGDNKGAAVTITGYSVVLTEATILCGRLPVTPIGGDTFIIV